MMLVRWIWLMLAALLALAPIARAMPAEEREKLLTAATQDFAEGLAKLETDRPAAEAALGRSIDGFTRLVREGGIENGKLYYNIGNAHLLRGDIGRAILHYRRAEKLIAGDANLVQNLAYARQRIQNRVEAPAPERIRRALLFWHDDISARTRFWVFAACYAAAWGIGALMILGVVRASAWWAAAIPGVLALVLGASLTADQVGASAGRDAVIIDQAMGRKGPDAAAYERSFTDPLSPGLEVRIVEERPGWTLCELGDGRRTWLPSDAVEAVMRSAQRG